MVTKWEIRYSKNAQKDKANFRNQPALMNNAKSLIALISENPFQNPPPYEKLQPPRDNDYSRKINSQHRLVYNVNQHLGQIKVLSIWTHYER